MKTFIFTWILASVVFCFIAPWHYFDPCYGNKCMDGSAPAIFSSTPNFIQPACGGFCNIDLAGKTVFSSSELISDILFALVLSGLVTLIVKKSSRSKNKNEITT